MAAQYTPLEQKIEAARAEAARPRGGPSPIPPGRRRSIPRPPSSSPSCARSSAGSASRRRRTPQMAQQVAAALTQAVQQAGNLQMLPPQVLEPMKGAERAFQDLALQPMKKPRGPR